MEEIPYTHKSETRKKNKIMALSLYHVILCISN